MRRSHGPDDSYTEQQSHWWSRIGMTGFAFFLLKGILWLLAPVLFAVMH